MHKLVALKNKRFGNLIDLRARSHQHQKTAQFHAKINSLQYKCRDQWIRSWVRSKSLKNVPVKFNFGKL